MAEPTPNSSPAIQLRGEWSDPRALDPIFVDELQFQEVGDRCYVTFGQVRLPSMAPGEPPALDAEIRAVVRLVMTTTTLERMLFALNEAKRRPGRS